MHKQVLLGYKRLIFGGLTLLAIALQLSIHIDNGYNVINFFSYFTNLSNIFAATVLLIGAHYIRTKRKPSATFDIVRGAATVAMAVVGITFVTLLRKEDLGSLLPGVNILLHYVMPVYMVADWIYAPPKTELPNKHIAVWAIFPLAYLAYSILRGAATDWYAYPFLNPDKVHGYGGVALYCLGILIVFGACSWLLKSLSRHKKK